MSVVRTTSERSTTATGTRGGKLFRRANRWQKAIVVACALVGLHGVWVLFVPGVQLADSDLPCPPAIVAAVAGSGGVETVSDAPALAERHDAACAATGRRWLVAGLLQVGIATVWGMATLEWARVWRRSRRSRRRSTERGRGRSPEQGRKAV